MSGETTTPLSVARLFGGSRPLLLHTIRFPATLRLLVLAPHPDDFDAIGVTLRFFRDNGNRIDVAVLTSRASGVDDVFCSPPTTAAKAEIREKEQRASCEYYDFDERILRVNREAAAELGGAAPYAEAFEIEVWETGGQEACGTDRK